MSLPPSLSETLVSGIADPGWISLPGFLDEDTARGLAQESRAAWDQGDFRRAGVGRGAGLTIREDVRRDHVLWLAPDEKRPFQQRYLNQLEDLRCELNRHLYLGLFNFEGHFAVYPEGAFYKAHLDRHQNTQDRIVTAILYLNDGWQSGDGGELKLWTTPGEQDGPFEIIEPRLGTLVCFLAGDYWHEVLPAQKTRMSITGWFRRNAV